jgi:hypothetical protein
MTVYWGMALVLGGLPLAFPSLVKLANRPSYEFADSTATECALFVLTFNILFGVAAHIVGGRRDSKGLPARPQELEREQLATLRAVFPWVAGAFVLSAFMLLWAATGGNISAFKWSDTAVMYEGESQYGYVAACTCFMVFSCAVPFALFLKRWMTVLILLIGAYGVTQLAGSRVFLLPAFLSVATILILRLLTFRHGTMPRRFLGNLSVAVVLLVTAYTGMEFAAWSRSRYDVGSLARNPGEAWAEFSDSLEVQADASAWEMLYSFEAFPVSIPYCHGLTYAQMALIPIPQTALRSVGLGDIKTYNFSGIILARDLFGTSYEARFGSIHPTLWGDAYANFGHLGALLGIFWGLVLGRIERLLRGRPLLYLIALPSYASFVAVLVRGSMLHATFYFFNASMLIALLLLIMYLSRSSIYPRLISRVPGTFAGHLRQPSGSLLQNGPTY